MAVIVELFWYVYLLLRTTLCSRQQNGITRVISHGLSDVVTFYLIRVFGLLAKSFRVGVIRFMLVATPNNEGPDLYRYYRSELLHIADI